MRGAGFSLFSYRRLRSTLETRALAFLCLNDGWRCLGWAGCFGALMLAGCSQLGYYSQSIGGHLALMHAARPVDELTADPATDATLRARLLTSQRLRDFAVQVLRLPDNASYGRYTDLGRRAAVWNVVAAPPLSLELRSWCFAVAGCVNYRGYFELAEAERQAEELRAQGLDVVVRPVPAYSTLGWLNWAGGDPLLNTFIHWPEADLARLIFHELAHQVVYVNDDSTFNESFASAVEGLGLQAWLNTQASPQVRAEHEVQAARRQQFGGLMRRTRTQLADLYAGPEAPTQMLARKAELIGRFQADYQALKAAWGGFAGYDAYVRNPNNALFGAYATYDELVPGFEALFEREGGNWEHYLAAVRALAGQPRALRRDTLQGLADAAKQRSR